MEIAVPLLLLLAATAVAVAMTEGFFVLRTYCRIQRLEYKADFIFVLCHLLTEAGELREEFLERLDAAAKTC